MRKTTSGFTIVELLIVIVVIGILAAIALVAYNGTQSRARDADRRSDLAAIAKGLKLWYVDHGDYMETGSGCGANGDGKWWFNYLYAPKSMNDCLKDAGYISKDLKDPSGAVACASGSTKCFAYYKESCGLGTYLYVTLETLPAATNETDGTCASTMDTNYGINYVVKVD